MAARKERQLNYELLRIVAMLMIVCLHYLGKGGLLGDPARADMTATGYTAWLVEAFCLVAVNVYVLISGYFGVDTAVYQANGNRLTLREVLGRPFKIWKQVFFYSVVIGCGAMLLGVQEFDLYRMFSYCFPVVTEHYWFATAYVVLCLLMPFLNAGFSCLDEKEIRYLLAGLLLVFSVSKTIIPMQLPLDKSGYDTLWFIILYLTGACLRRYDVPLLKERWRAVALYLGSMTAVFASFCLLRIVWLRTGRLDKLINYGYSYNFLLCYTGAVGLFLAFAGSGGRQGRAGRLLERFRRPVERLAGATFGVYLIHEHINLRYEWTKWFHCEELIDSPVPEFLVHMVVSVLCVYLVCTLIELLRQNGRAFLALVLFLYPLRHAATGLDLMDAGYSLGNYRFFDTLNPTWRLATYLANVTGVVLSKLPFGDRWIGMNVYCGMLTGTVAAVVFLLLWKRYGQNRKGGCLLLFAAEFTALSLCWAPGVILYHYLGYLFMTAASLLLFAATIKNNNRYFVASGVILGLSVAVRMPNVTYMALILPVWCDCFWGRASSAGQTEKKNAWFRLLLTRTLYCIGGYLAGLLVPLAVICIRYGAAAYPEMIASLFGMTEHATDYKPASMVTAMFGEFRYSAWLLLFAGYMALGFLAFRGAARLGKTGKIRGIEKITKVMKIGYTAGLLVLLRFCYGRGLFDFDYTAYFSMYKWVVMYLLAVIALCVWNLLYQKAGRENRLWAVFLLVIIFVTPLGGNNRLYPVINNLFLVMPVSALMLAEVFRKSRRFGTDGFVFRTVTGFVIGCTVVQGVLFGAGFVFHDAGARDSAVRLELQCSSAGTGIRTTADRKQLLEELDRYLYENALNKKQVILYGDIPAVAYLMDMEPAVFTTWADLDSNSMDILAGELEDLSENRTPDALPVVILGRPSVERLAEADGLKYRKFELVRDFMEDNGYAEGFRNADYIVYVPAASAIGRDA